MKILVITQVFPPRTGGSGRWLWELYRRMLGDDVHVAAGAVGGSESFDRTSKLPITRVALDLPSWGVLSPRAALGYARALVALRRIARASRPGVLHCGKALPEGLLAWAIKRWQGIPYFCYVHGEELALARETRELAWLTRTVFRSASMVIANSDHSKAMLIDEWNVEPAKIAVLHPGVDTERFVPAADVEEVRRRVGWTGRRVILTVGALQKRKGQDTMIRALPSIRALCPDVLYSIVGEGWERDYLEGLAREHGVTGCVEFRGVLSEDDLVECYQACDVFALPNRRVGWNFEGFGIALIEAQACGKAVIAGASGGAPETIRPGETGTLISGDDAEALTRAAVSLLDRPETRIIMGQRAREWAVERFDWSVLVREARALFSAA